MTPPTHSRASDSHSQPTLRTSARERSGAQLAIALDEARSDRGVLALGGVLLTSVLIAALGGFQLWAVQVGGALAAAAGLAMLGVTARSWRRRPVRAPEVRIVEQLRLDDEGLEPASVPDLSAFVPTGTLLDPVVVVVVRLLHGDASAIREVTRAARGAPVSILPTATGRIDELAFVCMSPDIVPHARALVAHLEQHAPRAESLQVGMAVAPDDGAFDVARRRASEAAQRAMQGDAAWYDDTSRRLFGAGGLRRGALRAAVEAGQIHSLYQPFYAVASGAMEGAELLVRWNHPLVGELPPERFLARIEDKKELAELTQSVLARAARKAAAWEERLGMPFVVVANAGLADLCVPSTLGMLAHLLHHLGPSRLRIDIEIEEIVAAHDDERAMLVAHGEAGVQLLAASLTSPAQLDALHGLPVVGVKFDIGKPGGLQWSHLEMVARAARGRGLDVYATRVERPADLRRIAELGATFQFVQGYAISEPIDEPGLEDLITAALADAAQADADDRPGA